MYFSCNIPFSSLPVFLPTIIKRHGLLPPSTPPRPHSPALLPRRHRQHPLNLRCRPLPATGGSSLWFPASLAASVTFSSHAQKQVGVRYLGVFFAAAGMFPAIFNICALGFSTTRAPTRSVEQVSSSLNLIGQTGPLVGTRLYPAHEGPRYVKGMSICAAFMFFFNVLLAFVLRTYRGLAE
jgi:hypothetical protein